MKSQVKDVLVSVSRDAVATCVPIVLYTLYGLSNQPLPWLDLRMSLDNPPPPTGLGQALNELIFACVLVIPAVWIALLISHLLRRLMSLMGDAEPH
jgi:hypothetical protein